MLDLLYKMLVDLLRKGTFNFLIVDLLLTKWRTLHCKKWTFQYKIVDLLFVRVVRPNQPNPPGYRPEVQEKFGDTIVCLQNCIETISYIH